LIYQFEKGISLENIAVRSNGQLPVTQIGQPEIYQVNCQAPTFPDTVPYATGLFGIAEISTDIFAFVAGNYSSAALSPMLAMTSPDAPTRPSMRISKVMHIDSAMSLNGMTALQPQSHLSTLLIADSLQSVVYHLNLQTLSYSIVLNDGATMAPLPNAIPVIGINGFHYRPADGNFYYSNSLQEQFNRSTYRDHWKSTTSHGCGRIHCYCRWYLQRDFALGEYGTAYIAANPINEVFKVTQKGEVSVVAGGLNDTTVAGDASAALGRTERDKNVQYVATNGVTAAPVNGTYTEGGKIVAARV
ncbi:uncharacterized protein K441DRAFT_522952, partial [Cenococcum geophilum 1.58]|uniref:uncharacterized protein n=1 Tax=Cenococcum geophilum 1.58 TaxID=794803 RepID=UPI0035901EAE